MSAPQQPASPSPNSDPRVPPLGRAAIWVAIGALIAAAVVSVVWVLVGSQNGIVGRAFLTIFLLAAFAGVAILDAHLAARRPSWFVLVSIVGWVFTLLVGALLIWLPERRFADGLFDGGPMPGPFGGLARFASFLLIVLIVQLAVLHIRLYSKAVLRVPSVFNRVVGFTTMGLVAVLMVLLVVPLALHEWVEFFEIYWRVVVAITILAAVGTAIVPLVNLLFRPRPERPAAPAPAWPTYADGVTPLPALADGTPDWQAYYTGRPTAWAITPSEPPVSTGYEGYPPPPPLPPR